jgi:hypothetical protein
MQPPILAKFYESPFEQSDNHPFSFLYKVMHLRKGHVRALPTSVTCVESIISFLLTKLTVVQMKQTVYKEWATFTKSEVFTAVKIHTVVL